MKTRFRFPFLTVLVASAALAPIASSIAEEAQSLTPARAATRGAAPEQIADGWETASLSSVGMDAGLMKDLMERLDDKTYKNIHSMLVVKNGKLVVEEYFTGQNREGQDETFKRDTLHTQQSVTKSVNSLLIGIAIDQHLIPGVEEKVAGFFPDHADVFAKDGKDKIRLKDCLSMSAGFVWDESKYPYTDMRNDAAGMNRSSDAIQYIFERPVKVAPGKEFVYHSGLSITLGKVLHKASGVLADEFAERHLFGPLGITRYRWGKLPDGSMHTGGGLWLRPRDMAKIGYLCLNGGRWQGKQIVSEAWVRESTKQQVPYRGYGYQWWLSTFRGRDKVIETYAAKGLGGQFIIVIPELQMVAVFTGWNMGALAEQPFDMMQRYIVRATNPP